MTIQNTTVLVHIPTGGRRDRRQSARRMCPSLSPPGPGCVPLRSAA